MRIQKAPCPPCMNVESFCLMWYGTGKDRVRIWNARDGVSPFYIDSVRKHEDWHLDEFAPWHHLSVGDLVFVDLTEARARDGRIKYVERWWSETVLGSSSRMCDRWDSKQAAVDDLTKADLEQKGQPDLLTVRDQEHALSLRLAASEQLHRLGLLYEPRRFA